MSQLQIPNLQLKLDALMKINANLCSTVSSHHTTIKTLHITAVRERRQYHQFIGETFEQLKKLKQNHDKTNFNYNYALEKLEKHKQLLQQPNKDLDRLKSSNHAAKFLQKTSSARFKCTFKQCGKLNFINSF